MIMGTTHTRIGSILSLLIATILNTVVLTGCKTSTAPIKESAQITESSKNKQTNAGVWPTYTDKIATNYINSCRKNFDEAVSVFNQLKSATPSETDRDILNTLNQLDIILDRTAGKASLFRNVHPSAEVRASGDVCQQKLMALVSEISLSRPIYNKVASINTEGYSKIDKYYVEDVIKGFKQSGVNKDQKTRDRIRALNEEILMIGQTFSSNIREDVRTIEVAPADLAGLPQDYIDSHPVNDNGTVTISTDYPDYLPISQYAENDDLRLKMYKVFKNRGYPANKEVLKSLLEKRYELARLLEFANYADYVTSDKMIGSASNAASFIGKINRIAKERSQQDYDVLLNQLKTIDPTATEVGDWQKTYLENLIRTNVYKVDAQEVRQYFSYRNVRAGIFDLVEDMFNVSIVPWQTDVWDESVESYQMFDNSGDGKSLIGEFYLDMHPREGKYKHAAAFGIREGVKDIQTPISALVCNFPGGDGLGLMEHSQVETFLHEFGHLLHGLFGGHQPWLGLSGISTERDFVEAPSQMLEEWVWDADTLKSFARNQKGELIPDALIAKMNNGRNFGKGIFTRHQMFYASISLGYYNQDPANLDLDLAMKQLQAEYSPFEYVDDSHFYANFGHLYGYSAIYYTYMWSLVIASDMFSEFEKEGLRNKEVAARYRKYVLEPGGSKPAAELVADFLKRPYSFDAFAKQLNVDGGH